MGNGILTAFKKNLYSITKYYKELTTMTKKNENIGGINEWIVDNYYIVSEQENYVKGEYQSNKVRTIKYKRRKQLYNVLKNILEEKDYALSTSYLFERLNKYQEENKDYFSFYEINYLYLLIRIILVSKLTDLAKNLRIKLIKKRDIDDIFKEVNKDIQEKDTLDIEK